MTDIPRLLTDAYLRNQIQRAIRARMGSDLDISACVTADVMDIVGPALEEIRRERDAACDDVADQYDEIVQLRSERNAARAEAARESKLASEARHERDTARKEAREARREAARLITGDRSDVLHWAVRQLRKIPMPTALTGPYWYGQGWKEAINYLEHDLGGLPTDAQVEMVKMAEEIGRLKVLADRRWVAWKSACRRAANSRIAAQVLWEQIAHQDARETSLEDSQARLLGIVADWVATTAEFGGVDHGDLVDDLEAAGYTLPTTDEETR